jgi:hypothetical protein
MSTKPFFQAASDAMRDQNAGVSDGGDSQSVRRNGVDYCACGLVSRDAPGDAYNEEAFRYFLDVERRRSELSNRPFVLLLVDFSQESSVTTPDIDAGSAQKLFSALSACVRETDFIGWYRACSVAGAVLTQHSDTQGADVQEAVSRRFEQSLRKQLPSELEGLVRVRVFQLPSALQSVS